MEQIFKLHHVSLQVSFQFDLKSFYGIKQEKDPILTKSFSVLGTHWPFQAWQIRGRLVRTEGDFFFKFIFSLFFLQKLHFSCSYKIVKERHVDEKLCWNSFFVKAIWKIIGFAFFGSKCFSWVAKSKISVKLLQLARIFCVSFLQFFAWEREGEVNLFCFFGSNCSSQVALHLLFTLGKLS